LDENKGWLAGEFNLYRTVDGGRKWKAVDLPWSSANVSSVYFSDEKNGWIKAAVEGDEDERVFFTSDGGRTWQQLSARDLVGEELPERWRDGKLFQMLAEHAEHRN
jgi:photosystem II stability/assembly factor-like uncharacterized protein